MSTPARERSGFGQFQLNRSGIDIGVDYSKIRHLSTADMAEMLRDGATLAEIGQAFGRSVSTVVSRLKDAGWSSRDGQPLGASPELDPEPAPDAPVRIPQYQIAFVPQPWAGEALCAQTDPEIFFPDKGGSTREAKAVCARCPVAAECLEYALATSERFGIWGGLSERERRTLRGYTVACTDPECTEVFATEKDRDFHVRTHEPAWDQVTCPTCDLVFRSRAGFVSHDRIIHHPDTERTAS
jgi:WhiB family transcriptional regulator, redox-sensing transcriptional regulator